MSRVKKKKKSASNKYKPDKIVLYFAIIMAIFGAIMIFDASVYQATAAFNDQFRFLRNQMIWLGVGSIIGIAIYYWDYRKISKLAFPALVITIGMLIAVLIVGDTRNGSTRWISLGFVDIQPAEFAKIIMIIYLSSWLSKKDYNYKEKGLRGDFLKNFLGFSAILGTTALLIMLEPDLGTTLIIFATSFIMFLIAGDDKLHTQKSLLVIILFIPFIILAAVIEPYRLKRIQTFLSLLITGEVADPRGSGYQMQQILIGIGSGGFLGKGFGQSRQRFGYLVENTAFTDSIFAVILEELGLLGGTMLIIGWILFLWRGIKIAFQAPDKQGKLLAAGITIWLVLQALMNMAANVGLIPLTGIPIPFLTYGGSSTIVTITGIAILLNISKYSTNAK